MEGMEVNQIIHGDCLQVLRTFPSNTVDSVVTDPPYGLGFMNKSWDKNGIAFNSEVWQEVYRVLKPGGHLLAFGGTRTYHRIACAIEDAGFEIRDSIDWIYGSGFPKNMDISKQLDKMAGAERSEGARIWTGGRRTGCIADSRETNLGTQSLIKYDTPATELAQQWNGWGTALKPSHEPIIVARKPISEKTVAANVLKWGTGGINIDGCRVEYQSEEDKNSATPQGKCTAKNGSLAGKNEYPGCDDYAPDTLNPVEEDRDICTNCFYRGIDHRPRQEFERPELKGRWPANIVLTHNANCTKAECTDGCPCKIMDEQSGVKPSTRHMSYKRSGGEFIDSIPGQPEKDWFKSETGGASRYFTQANWQDDDLEALFLYQAKASKKERNAGLDEFESTTVNDGRKKDIDNPYQRGKTKRQNIHPTVKPVKLMEWLITLVTPPNGTVLDPFAGSGTTGVAAKNLRFNYILIEKQDEYIPIIEARLSAAQS